MKSQNRLIGNTGVLRRQTLSLFKLMKYLTVNYAVLS